MLLPRLCKLLGSVPQHHGKEKVQRNEEKPCHLLPCCFLTVTPKALGKGAFLHSWELPLWCRGLGLVMTWGLSAGVGR
jgi:hypothetical protein